MSSPSSLPGYKADFIAASISGGILKFGSFELKSKRISPYFFNTGLFYTGKLQRALATAYAQTIIDAEKGALSGGFDVLFGPAYKGIPLAAVTNLQLAAIDPSRYDDVGFAFDRKEAKDHGEGGSFVGAPLKGKRVLIIDDVVSAGTAKREAIDKIRAQGGVVVGIVIALDRMEKLPSPDGDDGKPMPSAIGSLRKEYGIPIIAVITLEDILQGIRGVISEGDIKNTEAYREQYKPSD